MDYNIGHLVVVKVHSSNTLNQLIALHQDIEIDPGIQTKMKVQEKISELHLLKFQSSEGFTKVCSGNIPDLRVRSGLGYIQRNIESDQYYASQTLMLTLETNLHQTKNSSKRPNQKPKQNHDEHISQNENQKIKTNQANLCQTELVIGSE